MLVKDRYCKAYVLTRCIHAGRIDLQDTAIPESEQKPET